MSLISGFDVIAIYKSVNGLNKRLPGPFYALSTQTKYMLDPDTPHLHTEAVVKSWLQNRGEQKVPRKESMEGAPCCCWPVVIPESRKEIGVTETLIAVERETELQSTGGMAHRDGLGYKGPCFQPQLCHVTEHPPSLGPWCPHLMREFKQVTLLPCLQLAQSLIFILPPPTLLIESLLVASPPGACSNTVPFPVSRK